MKNVRHSKSFLGTHRVSYDCPLCGARLRSPLTDAGKPDHCPDCNAEFVVPGTARLDQHLREKAQAEQPRIQERERKKQLQLEKKQRKQEILLEKRRLKAERQRVARDVDTKRRERIEVTQERGLQPEASRGQPGRQKNVHTGQKVASDKPVRKRRHRFRTLCLLAILAFMFWLTCGFFVIQPIGAIPDGVTILYWRLGTKLPFVSSADSILEGAGAGVSILGRAMTLAAVAEPIKERKLISFGYSRTLYLWSTKGKEYDR